MSFEIKQLNETWYENVDWANSGIEARRIPSSSGKNICACDSINKFIVFSLVSNCYEMKDQEYFYCLVIDNCAFEFSDFGDHSALLYSETDFKFIKKDRYDIDLYQKHNSIRLIVEGYNLMREFYRSQNNG